MNIKIVVFLSTNPMNISIISIEAFYEDRLCCNWKTDSRNSEKQAMVAGCIDGEIRRGTFLRILNVLP